MDRLLASFGVRQRSVNNNWDQFDSVGVLMDRQNSEISPELQG
jgi:hypothetical protein